MSSPREQLANRVAAHLASVPGISDVTQEMVPRDDGRPGPGRGINFIAKGAKHRLVVWNEKRLDFNSGFDKVDAWFTFGTEFEFYDFIGSSFLRE